MQQWISAEKSIILVLYLPTMIAISAKTAADDWRMFMIVIDLLNMIARVGRKFETLSIAHYSDKMLITCKQVSPQNTVAPLSKLFILFDLVLMYLCPVVISVGLVTSV